MSDVIVIKAYSDTVKKSFGSSMSQGRFMREVFKASGYDRFPSSSDEDYAKKICNGSKPITDDMIAGFPKPYWIEELADYFVKHIDKKKYKCRYDKNLFNFRIYHFTVQDVFLLS